MMSSPTQRSLAYLKRQAYLTAVVERFNAAIEFNCQTGVGSYTKASEGGFNAYMYGDYVLSVSIRVQTVWRQARYVSF